MFRDMTIHDFDMARFIMGEEPVSVYAQGSNLVDPAIGEAGDIDTAFIVLKYAPARWRPSSTAAVHLTATTSVELHGLKGCCARATF
jgi:predicted dehydrogenase